MIETLRADGDINSINGLLDILQKNIAEADSRGGGGGGGGSGADTDMRENGGGVHEIENLLDSLNPHQLAQIGARAQDRINAARTLRRNRRGAKITSKAGGRVSSKLAYTPRKTRASTAAATGALVGKGKAKATAEEEMAPTVTGKRKADASIADADDTTDDKRVRTAKEPTSVSGVKMGWKLRKKFPGHGPYSTVFASTLQIVCSPRFIFFLAFSI